MLAKELIALHDAPRQVPPFSERYAGLTPEQGYDAARALHEHRLARGWRAVGRKIGFTNRTIWARYGVYEPMWGTVYDRTLIDAASGKASVALHELVQPRIEPEICFKLRAAPTSPEPQALLECLEWVAHSVEIVQCHHPGWKVSIADCTADNGLHGRLIVGPGVPVDSVADLANRLPRMEVLLKKNHGLVDRGVGENVLGSPLLALGHLFSVLARQAQAPQLAAGEIVTTGVLSDAHPVSPGERWSTEIAGLPLPGLEIAFR
jgi:2-oxo-3-hexenedioate decarboxylase